MYSVLIVDDEAIQREYLRLQIPALDGRFAIAGEAADGQEALAFLERQEVDLLVTDIKMPGMSGLDLCRCVNRRYPRMKTVILTGYEEFEFVRQALEYKAEQYLLKPLNREAARRTLARLAEQFERARADEAAMRGLLAHSDVARKQVARRFLQALIAGSQAEINALYPLACRLKIPLFEGEGALLLLTIDEVSLRDRQIPPKDVPVFRYILNQVAAEIAEPLELAWTLFDGRERTAILLSGTGAGEAPLRARELFTRIQGGMDGATGLAIAGGLSVRFDDLPQLENAYRTALTASFLRFRSGGGRLYEHRGPETERAADAMNALLQASRAIASDPRAGKRLSDLAPALDLLGAREDVSASAAYALGAYLLDEAQSGLAQSTPERRERARRTLERLLAADSPPRTPAFVLDAYWTALAALHPEAEDTAPSGETNEPALIDEIRRFIEEHYAEPISLALLSDRFGVSQQHISAAFHRRTGIPYVKYLTQVRMEHAARLLTERPDAKIFEIAEQVGYANVRHFSHVFKKHFGITPGEYPGGGNQETNGGAERCAIYRNGGAKASS